MTTFEAVPQGTFYAIRQNVARGITPSVSIWDTPPDHLERVTDGDVDTVTGTGQTTLGAAGTAGIVKLDFPHPVTGFVVPYFGFWTDGVYCTVFIDQYVGGTLYYAVNDIVGSSATSEQRRAGLVSYLTDADSMRLRFYLSGAGTLYAKFYEIAVYEVIP